MKRCVQIAKKLRKSSTDTEKFFWKYLSRKQFNNLKFRRQVPIGKYIVDFVCFEKRIIIECDGGQHSEEEKDKERDIWLKQEGYQVLRFWNNDVLQNIEGVLITIADACYGHPPLKSPPLKGGEKYSTTINGIKLEISQKLVAKYDRAGPRYTSYPTAPVWTDKFNEDNYISALQNSNTLQLTHLGTQALRHLSLYFHIPFCSKRCSFCGCSTIETSRDDAGTRYIKALAEEMKLVTAHLDAKRHVSQLHYGGGTPTFLSCSELEILWKSITDRFAFADDAEIGIEIDPRVTTLEQISLLCRLGFNRISMGVQDFSASVQNAIGRVESFEHVKKTIENARSSGFKSVNIDLVYGLPYQTKETFKATVDKIIELAPDRIACFNFAYLPKMMPHQRKLPSDKLPSGDEKFGIFCRTIEQLCGAGYDFIGMDHFAKSNDELSTAARNGTLWRNFQGYTTKAGTDLIGFGLTSISDCAGSYAQNEKRLINYYRAIEAGRLATIKGWKLTEDDLAVRKIIRELFCNGTADLHDLPPHPSPPPQGGRVRERVNALVTDGLIQINNNIIHVTPLGRLFIRNIAMAFDKYLNPAENKFSRTL